MMAQTIFWILTGIILYNYFGYPLILAFLLGLKNIFVKRKIQEWDEWPEVTLLIPAYNELDYIEDKLANTQKIDYPKEKLKVVWVTDGSNDGTPERLKKETNITVWHQDQRSGKIGAVNRVMPLITSKFVVFCDANSMLSTNAVKEIIKPFHNSKVGCVAGVKSIVSEKQEKAVGKGEGMYWNYESLIKKLESEIGSTVGAAGELFALRTKLFKVIPSDSVIEDFVIALSVIRQSYKTKYAHKAISEEKASLNVKEELKRKIRIAFGSIQTFVRNLDILNFFKYGFFSFEYFSHKVLRWTIVPFAIFALLPVNIYICAGKQHPALFDILLTGQGFFYFLALLGGVLKNKKISFSVLFLPFYLLVMNYAILRGYMRFFFSGQSVSWEKAKRG